MKIAAAYYRMSTQKQDKSISAQREEVERYAHEHDYKIVRESRIPAAQHVLVVDSSRPEMRITEKTGLFGYVSIGVNGICDG